MYTCETRSLLRQVQRTQVSWATAKIVVGLTMDGGCCGESCSRRSFVVVVVIVEVEVLVVVVVVVVGGGGGGGGGGVAAAATAVAAVAAVGVAVV